MDFVAFVRMIRRHLMLIGACTLAGGLVGIGSTFLGGSESVAPAEVGRYVVSTSTINFDGNTLAVNPVPQFRTAEQVARLATSAAVVERAADEAGTTAAELGARINTFTRPSLDSVDVVVFGRDADQAAREAQAVAEGVIDELVGRADAQVAVQTAALTDRLNKIRDQRRAFDAQLAEPGISPSDRDEIEAQRDASVNIYRITYERLQRLADVDLLPSSIGVLDPVLTDSVAASDYRAALDRARSGASHLVAETISEGDATPEAGDGGGGGGMEGPFPRAVLGTLLGFGLGLGLAMARDRFDSRLHTRRDFEEAFALPILAEIPRLRRDEIKHRRIVCVTSPFSRASEAYRSLRTSLLLLAGEREGETRPGLVVMITSPGSREGKSTTAANLSAAFGEAGLRVLAVNCDFRRPVLHRHFGVPNSQGEVQVTQVPGVSVVTDIASGRGLNPTGIVAAQRAFIEQVRSTFDVVVLDTAPLLATNDPVDVSVVANLAVVVARPEVTREGDARRAQELLDRHHVTIAGLVVVGTDSLHNDYYYYYSREAAPEQPRPAGTIRTRRGRRGKPDAAPVSPSDTPAIRWSEQPTPRRTK